jgi:hypothetical protein
MVLWYGLRAKGWEIIIPDQLPGSALVFLACLGSAWLVIFVFRAIFIEPALRYREANSEITDFRGRLEAEQSSRPRIDIARILMGPTLTSAIPVLSIDFSITNPGPPTVFPEWELWVKPADGDWVGVQMTGNLGLDGDGDLRTRPLQTGERRTTTFELFHHALLDFDGMSRAGTAFVVETHDVRGREIKGEYVFPSDDI